jgi:quinol monooxygenase YgiN
LLILNAFTCLHPVNLASSEILLNRKSNMVTKHLMHIAVTSLSVILLATCSPSITQKNEDGNQLVRLAVIEVDSSKTQLYNEFLREEIEASIRLEPGVITLYGVAEKGNPQHVTLFETYADSSQYRSHLETPHFQKYKQGTLQMVTHLDLIQMQPIFYHRKPELSHARPGDLYIRLIKIELEANAFADFDELGNAVMLPGIKEEPGVLVMYAVAEKNRPTSVSILEVYENLAAYHRHVQTPHYLQYKEAAKTLVKSLQFSDVDPIQLGSKP